MGDEKRGMEFVTAKEGWPCGPTATRGWVLCIALLVMLLGSKSVLYDTMDPDCFWHLRVAEQLMRHGIGPIVDDLAFTSSKVPWTPYSWLAELFMRDVWSLGGFRAAVAVQAIVIASMYTLLAMSCLQRGASRMAVVIVLIAGGYLSLPYLSFRPATFALAMLSLAVWLLVRDRALRERSRAVWWILPLTALMVNVHLFAFVVPASVAALFLGAIVERTNVRRYAVMFVLSSLACLATPMLRGMLATMWFYQSGDTMVAGPTIAELMPFYSGPLGWVSLLLVLGGIAACFANRATLRAGEWFWLAGALLLLFRMGRFAPLFVLIAGPIVAVALPRMNGRVLEKPVIRLALVVLLVIGSVRIATGFPTRDMKLSAWLNRMGPGTPGYPCAAADYLASHVDRQSGRVLNEFGWGGYLAWRLGPEFQTFMDGRTQVFPASFWKQTCMGTPRDLQNYLATTSADAAIVPVDKGALRAALIALGWRKVFTDDRAAVYVPDRSSAAAE